MAAHEIRIVYFSGTGGTKKAAELLAVTLEERGARVIRHELSVQTLSDMRTEEDLLVIMYPVYALSAPGPVFEYIKKLREADKIPAAVLSVSGGGEVTPNKACRVRAVRLLEKKGYHVVYEKMLVMPSNVFVNTPFDVAVCLLRVLPGKINKIADDLLNGRCRRTKPGLINRLLSIFGELEKAGAKLLGRHIKVCNACTSCGICLDNCPMGNITLKDNKPVFGKKCVTCLKCFYNCPQKALTPGYGKFIVLKEGFNLADIEKAAADTTDKTVPVIPKGFLFGGLKIYLEEID